MQINWRQMRYRMAGTYALRLTVAAVIGLMMAQVWSLRLPLWVVLTAIIVTQTSLGRSLKVTLDYLAGTLVGALWGGLVELLIPQTGEAAMLVSLTLALAPTAVAAALRPRFAAAPVTAAIVLLLPQMNHMSALASIVERVSEVGLGSAVGLLVSMVLLPSSAARFVREQAAVVLERMATAAAGLIGGLEKGLDETSARALQLSLGPLLSDVTSVAGEAERERTVRLGGEDTGPLLRSLMRLRHDLVIIGRAAGKPLPAALLPSFKTVFGDTALTLQTYFAESARSLRDRRPAPPLEAVDAAVARCAAAVDAARQMNQLRALPGEDIEHLFAVGFALEQVRRNLADLKRCIDEWAA